MHNCEHGISHSADKMVISGARRCSASATRRCTRDMLGDSHPIEASCDYADHDAGAPSQLQTNGSIHLPAQEQPKPHLVSKKKQASGAAAAVSNSQHTVVSPCDEGTLQHIKKLGKGAEAKVRDPNILYPHHSLHVVRRRSSCTTICPAVLTDRACCDVITS